MCDGITEIDDVDMEIANVQHAQEPEDDVEYDMEGNRRDHGKMDGMEDQNHALWNTFSKLCEEFRRNKEDGKMQLMKP